MSATISRKHVKWEIETSRNWSRHAWDAGFEIIIKEGILFPGDNVIINLGGSKGYHCQSFIQDKFCFRIGIKTDSSSKWIVTPLSASPGFKIAGANPVKARVQVPNIR